MISTRRAPERGGPNTFAAVNDTGGGIDAGETVGLDMWANVTAVAVFETTGEPLTLGVDAAPTALLPPMVCIASSVGVIDAGVQRAEAPPPP